MLLRGIILEAILLLSVLSLTEPKSYESLQDATIKVLVPILTHISLLKTYVGISKNRKKESLQINGENNSNVNRCDNGILVNQLCSCHNGWTGSSCSINIQKVGFTSLQVLSSETEQSLLEGNIHLINVNQENTRVFLAITDLDKQLEEIRQEDYKFNKLDRLEVLSKIMGKVDDTVSFQATEICSRNTIMLLALLPVIVAITMFTARKLRGSKSSRKKQSILSVTTSDLHVCAICLTEDPITNKVVLHCDHSFHDTCLRQWLVRNDTCPYCRYNIVSQ